MVNKYTPPHLMPVELHVKLPRDLSDRLVLYLSNNKSINKTEVVCKALETYLKKNVDK